MDFYHLQTSFLDSFLRAGPNSKGWVWPSALSFQGFSTGRIRLVVRTTYPWWWMRSPQQRNQNTPGRRQGNPPPTFQQGPLSALRSTREQRRTPEPNTVVGVRSRVSCENTEEGSLTQIGWGSSRFSQGIKRSDRSWGYIQLIIGTDASGSLSSKGEAVWDMGKNADTTSGGCALMSAMTLGKALTLFSHL